MKGEHKRWETLYVSTREGNIIGEHKRGGTSKVSTRDGKHYM